MTRKSFRLFCLCSFIALTALSLLSCTQIQKPVTEPFFAATAPPTMQEFRWSNGKRPKTLDPARAAAAPETDIVRAIFEGLTELDARTLDAVPAVAEKWSASADSRVWTFVLRKDARWSNGKRVTAADFVRSWKRIKTLGDKTAHRELFKNIVGFEDKDTTQPDSPDFQHPVTKEQSTPPNEPFSAKTAAPMDENSTTTPADGGDRNESRSLTTGTEIGVEAVNDLVLKISVVLPDKDFPKLVANPIFRPIHGDGSEFEEGSDQNLVTNGPFVVTESGANGVVIGRSNTYWNKSAVKLERITFVPKDNAEAALDAYKKGEIDAVTNARFEPLALKLLEPYEDFRRTKHSALNFYEFNLNRAPFSDRRVREALATAIDRERLIETELDNAARPATDFLPFGDQDISSLSFDVKKARELLEKSGYPNGEGFPKIRLVINRNDIQQRVAAAVAKMWKQHLNVDTQIVPVENNQMEMIRSRDDFDIIRRGVVLPTTDEMVSLTAIFRSIVKEPKVQPPASERNVTIEPSGTPATADDTEHADESDTDTLAPVLDLMTREDALYEVRSIPLYFPESYALVKPFVYGFDTNALDAPSIRDVGINNAWQPPKSTPQN
jgi:oligopeptide transport system substrate-binding protein